MTEYNDRLKMDIPTSGKERFSHKIFDRTFPIKDHSELKDSFLVFTEGLVEYQVPLPLDFTKKILSFIPFHHFEKQTVQVIKDYKSGYLYLLYCHGLYKIGITSDLNNRLTAYNTHNPFKIEVIKKVFISDARKAEKILLSISRGYGKENKGEWFKFGKREAEKIKQRMVRFEIEEKSHTGIKKQG